MIGNGIVKLAVDAPSRLPACRVKFCLRKKKKKEEETIRDVAACSSSSIDSRSTKYEQGQVERREDACYVDYKR